MTIRTILLPIRGDGKGKFVLGHALALARLHNAHIIAIHCRPRPEDMLPFGVPLTAGAKETIIKQGKILADEEEVRVRALFAEACKTNKLKLVDEPPSDGKAVTASWHEHMGKQAVVVAVQGRLADVVAVAQPEVRAGLGINTLQAALFETGRLVLMCPEQVPDSVGANVAVAWNGSAEAARAVALSLALMKKAKTVTVLAARTDSGETTSADALARYLGAHGIKARTRVMDSRADEVGQALLSTCDEIEADCLVMGAFGQSRWRELVMGGVTQHVVEHSARAVFFAH